jgi:hypothetical protein
VANDDLKKAQNSRDAQQKKNDRLRSELGKKAFLAQANLKKIVDKFREQSNVAIQAVTATTVQGWVEQAAKLQVLRADKANRDLRAPGF